MHRLSEECVFQILSTIMLSRKTFPVLANMLVRLVQILENKKVLTSYNSRCVHYTNDDEHNCEYFIFILSTKPHLEMLPVFLLALIECKLKDQAYDIMNKFFIKLQRPPTQTLKGNFISLFGKNYSEELCALL